MADERFADYLRAPRGHVPAGAHTGAAGGAACGDPVRVSVAVEGERVRDAGADAPGCGAAPASASAAAAPVRGRPVLDAARLPPRATGPAPAGVAEPWLPDHAAGLTPNPCVRCNGHVRLDAMLDFADRVGAERLATGHYARLTGDGLLRAAADPAKDQAYMLAALSRDSLRRMRFPLGE